MKLIDLQNNINFWRKIPFLCIPLDTPLSLLTETVRSMLALSDLFCEHSQFRWMFDHFNEIQKTHPIEDEMLTNLLRIGICKSIAVLGKNTFCKLEKILKGSLDSIPSSSVKIQIMCGKVCLRCKGKTLLGFVNKLLKTISLLTSPNNVLPYYLK